MDVDADVDVDANVDADADAEQDNTTTAKLIPSKTILDFIRVLIVRVNCIIVIIGRVLCP